MPTRVAVAEDVAAECGGEQVDNFVGAADRVQQPAGFGPAGILALLALLALPPTGRDAECLAERLAVEPPDVLSTLADDPVIARRDQAAPAADLPHARLGDRQADLAADRQAEHLVGDVFGVFAGIGLDHMRARQTGLGPGPAPAALVVEEGELGALRGQRHKPAFVHDESGGRWAWPEAGLPSTHVIKPDTGEYPEYVANEMFCLTVCRQVGLPVAKASVGQVGGRRCLVSPRYDRVVGEGGEDVRRLHCESFCQALGIPAGGRESEESEESEDPGWAEARGLLNAVSRPDEVVNLLTAAFCSYILGNGDVHGSNFVLLDREKSSLAGSERKWRLAPLTDITSTVVYDDPIHRGLVISDEYGETSYLLELAEVCEACEFDFEVMRGLAAATATRVGMAVETIATRSKKEGWHQPIVDKIVELAADRSFGLGAEVEY